MVGRQRGFTLVELAIVLVIIGLILGMAFKGTDLIDGAKVKNLAAQYNKFVAGFNTFYEKYGFYPGDGCNNAAPANVAACMPGGANYGGARNGLLTGNELTASLSLLQTTGILTNSDIQSVFGQPWALYYGAVSGMTGVWMGLPGGTQQDPRLICALDRMMDDGVDTTGKLRTTGGAPRYDATTDCWSLSGQTNFHMLLLP